MQDGKFCFLNGDAPLTVPSGILEGLKSRLKRWGGLYYSLVSILGPVHSLPGFRKCCSRHLKVYAADAVVVNLGSGSQVYRSRSDIINIDIEPFAAVDMVADAADLPIMSQTVDCILNMALLEHTADPGRLVAEIQRIIKPGGIVITAVPFMQPFHAAPHDYCRWTSAGVKELFNTFEQLETGIAAGPTSGMLWVLQEWLAVLLSLGSRRLHDIWLLFLMVLLFPLKYLDWVIARFPFADHCASAFYAVVRKNSEGGIDSDEFRRA